MMIKQRKPRVEKIVSEVIYISLYRVKKDALLPV